MLLVRPDRGAEHKKAAKNGNHMGMDRGGGENHRCIKSWMGPQIVHEKDSLWSGTFVSAKTSCNMNEFVCRNRIAGMFYLTARPYVNR